MPFQVGYDFAKIKIFIFRPKTMDYSPWFEFWESEKVCRKGYHQNEHLKASRMVQISAS